MRGILGMDENYTFRQFDHDLNQGFKIYLTFVDNRYLIYKSNILSPIYASASGEYFDETSCGESALSLSNSIL